MQTAAENLFRRAEDLEGVRESLYLQAHVHAATAAAASENSDATALCNECAKQFSVVDKALRKPAYTERDALAGLQEAMGSACEPSSSADVGRAAFDDWTYSIDKALQRTSADNDTSS